MIPTDEDETEPTSPDNEKSQLVVSDIFGLGAAAKSPAAKEIAKAINKAFATIGDPARILLTGLAKNKIETNRIVEIAKAEATARQITIIAENVTDRMKQRVIATEIRSQLNLEAALADGISHAENTSGSSSGRPIEDDWMAKWIEGAQEASSDVVRSLWSKVVASQATGEANTVSGPSLSLLRTLDGPLAQAFTKFLGLLLTYNCVPHHDGIKPGVIDDKTLAILSEIGFVRHATLGAYNFPDFSLRLGGGGNLGVHMFHGGYFLTQRALEIAEAVFVSDSDKEKLRSEFSSEKNKEALYLLFLREALKVGPRPIGIELWSDSGETGANIRLDNTIPDGKGKSYEAILIDLEAARVHPSALVKNLLTIVANEGLVANVVTLKRS